MNDKALYWSSMILGGLALLLILSNVLLINGNRNLQMEIGRRQTVINNNGPMDQLNKALVQALAQASVDNEDKELRELLASQGFTVKKNEKVSAASDSGDKADKSEKKK
jgi:hypothetical protein